ncbi:capsid protein [Crucivirus-427]|nr:capsid protein [Crucivirus-427]
MLCHSLSYNMAKRKLTRRRRRMTTAQSRLSYMIKKGRYGAGTMDPAQKRAMFGETFNQRLISGGPEQTAMQRMMRRATGYYGEGDYRDWAKYIPRGIGGAYGMMTGGMPGAKMGWDSGAEMSKLWGLGDYTGSYGPPVGNALIEGAGGPPAGITVNASDDLTGDIYLSHREYVGQITASATTAGSSLFQQRTFALNPALSDSFPFLSQLAQNYNLYEFQGLIYEYKPQMGEFANQNNNLGRIMMVTQYDPDAPPFLNSVTLQNYDYACSTKPSLALIHGVECARIQSATNIMYTRTGSSAKDKVFTDLGNFTVATEGIPFAAAGTQILGELWVTYRVKLSRAQLYESLGQDVTVDVLSNTIQIGVGSAWNPLTQLPLAGSAQATQYLSGKWTVSAGLTTATQSTISCALSPSVQSGTWRCDIYYNPSNNTDAAVTISKAASVGLTPFSCRTTVSNAANDILGTRRNPGATGGDASMYMSSVFVSVNGQGGAVAQTLGWTLTTAGSAGAYVKLIFSEVSDCSSQLALF